MPRFPEYGGEHNSSNPVPMDTLAQAEHNSSMPRFQEYGGQPHGTPGKKARETATPGKAPELDEHGNPK
jgi:hypothetical protein